LADLAAANHSLSAGAVRTLKKTIWEGTGDRKREGGRLATSTFSQLLAHARELPSQKRYQDGAKLLSDARTNYSEFASPEDKRKADVLGVLLKSDQKPEDPKVVAQLEGLLKDPSSPQAGELAKALVRSAKKPDQQKSVAKFLDGLSLAQ